MSNEEYDREECGCEECQACLRREIRGLEKALQVMSDARAADRMLLTEATTLLDGPAEREEWSAWRVRSLEFVKRQKGPVTP